MFTIQFIIAFVLFCLFCLQAIDDLTICDYRKQLKRKEKELEDLNADFTKLMDQDPATDNVDYRPFVETLRKINRIKKEISSLYVDIHTYPRFYKR